MTTNEPNVATLLGISKEEGHNIMKMLTEIQVDEEGLYPLIEVAAKKFDDKKSMFVGWVLGHMVAKKEYTDRLFDPSLMSRRVMDMSDVIMMDGATSMIESLKADRLIPDNIDKLKAANEAIRRYCEPMSTPIPIGDMRED